jgi:D-sedoheptulose 7-phosphate isomerase
MKEQIVNLLNESIKTKQLLVEDEKQIEIISKVVKCIIDAYKNNKKVIVFGNGGSAADAQHMVAELVGKI